MKLKKQDLDAIIDDTVRGIRDEQLDESLVDESAARIWARVSEQLSGEESAATAANSLTAASNTGDLNAMNNTAEHIDGCADFQSLIPAYLDKKLSTARTLLLEDHTNECIPCRRALKTQRANRAANAATYAVRQPARRSAQKEQPLPRAFFGGWNKAKIARYGIAAALVVCLGLAGMFAFERFDWSGRTLAATVENANGEVYVVSDTQSRPLTVGEQLQKGERVRTAKDSNAVLRLADGSTVEMRERSEFSVSENRRGWLKITDDQGRTGWVYKDYLN